MFHLWFQLRAMASADLVDLEQDEAGIFCTYCDSPVPAAKVCLHCEVSLCDKHLMKHNRAVEHVLLEPTTSWENRKCSIHKKALEYYCCEACICVYCSAGEHREHAVETLNEASEKKKHNLRNILEELTSERKEVEDRIQSLQGQSREQQETFDGFKKQVTDMIENIRNKLGALEKELMSEISRQTQKVSQQILDLEIKKEELSRKMRHIKELCNLTDPLTVLQRLESDRDDFCDSEGEDIEDTDGDNTKVVEYLRLNNIIEALNCTLPKFATTTRSCLLPPEASDMLLGVHTASEMMLDINTAGNYVHVSEDLKNASHSRIEKNRPETPERFSHNQVLSSGSFSSGKHYWEVEVNKSWGAVVGLAYPSIDRKGEKSAIGNNNKSWGLWICRNHYYVKHESKVTRLPHSPSCQRLGLLLDYEAGRLSIYELCDPVRHIHTITAVFAEPLHAMFGTYSMLEEPQKQIHNDQPAWVSIRSHLD
uniref:B30.2/SPRY domain-containing protein n=1 Tax=Leptobrachium leishanense TaxID=445787 RepID=A0A8C5Q5S5_9ANUR